MTRFSGEETSTTEFSNLKIIETCDGSPTLMGESEAMHNQKGALSETLEIYLPAFHKAQTWSHPFSVGSIGFGLGYVEVVFAAWATSQNIDFSKLISFERVNELYSNFQNYLREKKCEFYNAYEWIFEKMSDQFGIDAQTVKNKLLSWLDSQKWIQLGEAEATTENHKFNVCIFDMYSSKSNAHLWSENFLNPFIENHLCDKAIFVTYAATGSLKRCLKHQGFEVELNPGFGGKRHHTFATRGGH